MPARPALPRQNRSASPRALAGDWRMTWQAQYRPYQAVVIEGALAGPLIGSTLLLPLVLSLGLTPGVAWFLFLVPSLGVALQAVLPALLAAVGGRLRALTIASFLVSETRGVWFTLILAAHLRGAIGNDATLVLLGIVIVLTGVVGSMTANNLSVWYGLVLPDAHRRRLLPRVTAMSSAVSAGVLWVTTLVFASGSVGESLYATCFAVGGFVSLIGLWGILRLPDPGRVRVRPAGAARAAAETAGPVRPASGRDGFRNFCIASTAGAAGGGFMPAIALLALGPLGLPVSFTVTLAAVSSTLTLLGSGAAASVIASLSASRVFRLSQFVRLVETALVLVAVVATPLAPLLLVVATMSSALTSAVNGVAGSELLYRMSGPDIVTNQGRYSALTHGAFTVTSLAASAIITASATVPVFVGLLTLSGTLRLVGGAMLTVSPGWRDDRPAIDGRAQSQAAAAPSA